MFVVCKGWARCVGFDPITKRELPRAYVYYLQSRLTYLETLLSYNGISFAPGLDFDLGTKISPEQVQSQPDPLRASSFGLINKTQEHGRKPNNLLSDIGMVLIKGASDPRYLGFTAGIPFARVVFASIKTSVSAGSYETGVQGASKPAATANRSTDRDSLWGLQPKRMLAPASCPDREVGERLVALYFEHANSQISILHKGVFMALFHRAYASAGAPSSAREICMLNVLFVIRAGIIPDDSCHDPHQARILPIRWPENPLPRS
ncbi:MAG: hypothetical protein Q9208_002169 [Pyrenodesmia sp. 3 TL-2023]